MTQIGFTPVDPAGHVEVIHEWMQEPHVVPWWRLDGSPQRVRDYLEAQCAMPHLTPWVVDAAGEPFAYLETYRAADDPLAAAYEARPGDLGWHVLVGPARFLGSGVPREMGHMVVRWLFRHHGASRVVCEPDVRNRRMIAFCQRLGGRVAAEIELPEKRAALIVWDHDPDRERADG